MQADWPLFAASNRASARLVDGPRLILAGGDIGIFPHGDAHILENGSPTKAVNMAKDVGKS
jgi:hypothetical protein